MISHIFPVLIQSNTWVDSHFTWVISKITRWIQWCDFQCSLSVENIYSSQNTGDFGWLTIYSLSWFALILEFTLNSLELDAEWNSTSNSSRLRDSSSSIANPESEYWQNTVEKRVFWIERALVSDFRGCEWLSWMQNEILHLTQAHWDITQAV
jgi:hypothetical protein